MNEIALLQSFIKHTSVLLLLSMIYELLKLHVNLIVVFPYFYIGR